MEYISYDKNKEITTIKQYWASFLGSSLRDIDNTGVVLTTSKNINKEEIYIFNWLGGGTIISTHPETTHSSIKHAYASDIGDKENDIIETFYLFSINYHILFEKSTNIIKMNHKNRGLFQDFLNALSGKELQAIDVNLIKPEYVTFGYIDKTSGKIIALANYQIDRNTKIAHIGIITLPEKRSNGYATELINFLLHEILQKGYIAQWRAKKNNKGSISLAKKFGFQKTHESYSIFR